MSRLHRTDLFDALAPGQVEDFITNAFCWLLSNTDFGVRFLDFLGSKGLELPRLARENLVWETQTPFPREREQPVRPDMTLTDAGRKHGIIFEHKAWSELHDKQLENYRKYGDGPFKDAPIVLITAYPGQHRQCPDLPLCWYQVHRWLKKQLEETEHDPVANFVVGNFCTLLDRKGLGPMKRLREEVFRNYFGVKELPDNLKKMMRAMSGMTWPGDAERDVGEKWGRLGFDLRGNWNPGVFVGVMLDGWDHCTRPMCPEKGPDACVIVSIDKELQPAEERTCAYQRFVTGLESKEERLPPGWKLYHHAKDKEVIRERYGPHKGPNPWHPFHIRCPLAVVLGGTKTAENQVDKFYEDAHKVVELMWPYVEEDWTLNASR